MKIFLTINLKMQNKTKMRRLFFKVRQNSGLVKMRKNVYLPTAGALHELNNTKVITYLKYFGILVKVKTLASFESFEI